MPKCGNFQTLQNFRTSTWKSLRKLSSTPELNPQQPIQSRQFKNSKEKQNFETDFDATTESALIQKLNGEEEFVVNLIAIIINHATGWLVNCNHCNESMSILNEEDDSRCEGKHPVKAAEQPVTNYDQGI